jgi:hypothetical protein
MDFDLIVLVPFLHDTYTLTSMLMNGTSKVLVAHTVEQLVDVHTYQLIVFPMPAEAPAGSHDTYYRDVVQKAVSCIENGDDITWI